MLLVFGMLTISVSIAQVSEIGQKPDLKFQRINDGLLNNRVSAVYEDSRGFIWVGTYSGLHKYDGIGFKVYSSNHDISSLNDNYIGTIFEDSQKQLWIGTGSGVAKYNRETDDFQRFNLSPDTAIIGGEGNLVNTILEDQSGILWVSNLTSGLFFFDRDRQEFSGYKNDEITNINAIAAGEKNFLWIATSDLGLIKLNTKNGNTEYFQHNSTDRFSISSNNIKTVNIDLDGNLWAGGRGSGLNRMIVNGDKVSFVRYLNEPANPHSLYNNNIYKLYVDPQGNLWSCNENGGLHLYDKTNDFFYRYLHEEENPTSLAHNSIWTVFQDSQSRYWVGTAQSGLNLADPIASKFAHYYKNPLNPKGLSNDIIRDFSETKSGNIWIATDGGGLNYFDRTTESFKTFKNEPKNPHSLSSDAVISLNEDAQGKLWVGTWAGGLNILQDEKKGIFISFNEWIKNHTYPIRNVFDVHFDQKYIWVAALEEGLYRYEKNTGELRIFQKCDNQANCISSNWPLRIFEDSKSNLWIGTHSGLNVLKPEDKATGKFKVYQRNASDPHSLPSNSIRQIMEDRNQNIWIVTDRGLSKYIPEEDKFITFNKADGLPVNEINSIVEDDMGFLWIGTIMGISKFDPVNKVFSNYDKHDGLQGNEFSRYAVLKTREGELLFGGMNGFNLFHPEKLFVNPHVPQVYLTDLRLFNKSVNFKAADSPLQKHISVTDTLTLSYKENVLSLDFVALNYTNAEQNEYAYILEGFETEWNYVGYQRNATYTNLNPGTYTFRVKAANSDGIWNEAGTSLVLVITPPFWQTAWFYILATLLICALLTTVYKLRINAIQNQKKELKRIVEERTTMLKHSNAQLTQHINEKDKLFSIIGHDLRNPFVSIIGYMEMLEEEFESAQNTEHLKNIKYLLNVSRNTHNLLENLLQWASKKTKVYEVKPEVINMEKLMDTAIAMASPQAVYKNINLVKTSSDNISIHADKNMILTVLRNLISNAIKFSQPNSTIEIGVLEKSEDVITSVRDNGTGMEKSILDKLFSKADTQKSGTMGEFGTGLGLVLCQELIQKHDGKIWAESTPGIGSTFYFSLTKYELAEMAV